MQIKAAVITVSDSAHRGEREDRSGPAVAAALERAGATVVARDLVPDDIELIKQRLEQYCARDDVNLVVTTGGTGLSPRDNTPEATLAVVDKVVPGLAELMRSEGLKSTPMAALSRSVCGVRRRALIINLPGSVRGATESLAPLLPLLPHALELIAGEATGHSG